MICPVCLPTLAMIAAGATSTGGLAAIAVKCRFFCSFSSGPLTLRRSA